MIGRPPGSLESRGRQRPGVVGRVFAWSFVHLPLVANFWSRARKKGGRPPFAPLVRPLSEVRLGLLTTGGVHHRDQPPFGGKADSPQGDGSWRVLDLTRPPESLAIAHDWYDRRDAEEDMNLVLPVDRLREIAGEGIIGALHPAAVGLMGHVEGPEEARLEWATAPEVAAFFAREGVDAVLLVPA